MGMTIHDVNQKIYTELRTRGMAHNEIAERMSWILVSLKMSPFEAHFGSLKLVIGTTIGFLVIIGVILFLTL